ncbi:hypothetical protein DACRYDRAFT_22624 [Dacryopinax primogenitus]|uniref:Uncharacterized protein n=1 Tax=Dacryopinax primogenitus (strain DJM 731) TaxID=1858805 RepID=M5G026_DACPD|nr:uncharacterized protein DACRYDRAFT_22624 [Dacryopinax primogenitus]EJU01505.1 hypothetical protein DACRYDRAFT_22624 [Dacryopinax primogenitus]
MPKRPGTQNFKGACAARQYLESLSKNAVLTSTSKAVLVRSGSRQDDPLSRRLSLQRRPSYNRISICRLCR